MILIPLNVVCWDCECCRRCGKRRGRCVTSAACLAGCKTTTICTPDTDRSFRHSPPASTPSSASTPRPATSGPISSVRTSNHFTQKFPRLVCFDVVSSHVHFVFFEMTASDLRKEPFLPFNQVENTTFSSKIWKSNLQKTVYLNK